MAYADKQVLVRIPAYLPPEPYPKLLSPRHLQTSGSSSVKSGSSCCTSSDSASALRPNLPRIVRTPSKCRNGVYTYENNRSYSKMAEPLRAERNPSSGGRKRKYVDTQCAYLSPSNAAWRNAACCSHQLPSADLPAMEYPLRKTASMFHLDGQSHGRSPSVFDAGFKANLLRARLDESKDLNDLLRLADGTYDGNEFDFNENTKGLGDDHDLEGFRDLKISEPQDEENGQFNGPQRSSSTSYTEDNSTSSPLKPLHVAVNETDALDYLADDALAELNKVLEPSQPLRPQMLPADGRINVAEQVTARLNGDCDLCDPRHLNRSPLCPSRENRHAPPAGGRSRGGCHPHSWNADILRAPPRACGQTFLMRNLERRPSPQSRLSEPIAVHGLVEREPNVRSRVSPYDDQMRAGHTQKPNSYPRLHQPQMQQGWQANEKKFGCDEWGRNGIALMQTYTVLRPSPQAANNHSDCTENQTVEPPNNRDRESSANESDASSIDLDDRYGLGE